VTKILDIKRIQIYPVFTHTMGFSRGSPDKAQVLTDILSKIFKYSNY